MKKTFYEKSKQQKSGKKLLLPTHEKSKVNSGVQKATKSNPNHGKTVSAKMKEAETHDEKMMKLAHKAMKRNHVIVC